MVGNSAEGSPRVATVLAPLAILLWWALWKRPLPGVDDRAVVIGAPLVAACAAILGRQLVAGAPRPGRVARVTAFVHGFVGVPLGAAIAVLARTQAASPTCPFGFPRTLAFAMVLIAALALAATVANLALRGRGAPFAVALTSRLASAELYAVCRNPMVAAGLGLLLSLGLLLGSGALIAWTLLLAGPAIVAFLKLYEERELELRFGDAYRAYRARTPFLMPRLRP